MAEETPRAKIDAFLAGDPGERANEFLIGNPWICDQLGVDFTAWSSALLAGHGFSNASMRIAGSAAIGFSLNPDAAGRAFRKIDGLANPSDIDLALLHEPFFVECWQARVRFDRGGPITSLARERENVYWGRIEDYCVPERSDQRAALRRLLDAARRSREFRGYPMNIRVYRHENDFRHYLLHGIRSLRRSRTS